MPTGSARDDLHGLAHLADPIGSNLLADMRRHLSGPGAGVGSLEQAGELVTSEREVPGKLLEAAACDLAIEGRQLRARHEILPGDHQGPLAVGIAFLPPAAEHPAEIEERIAESRELPIHHARDPRRMNREKDIGELQIAVN